MGPETFESLLDRYLGGEATSDEMAELGRLLLADPAKRRAFVERSLLEVQLGKVFSGIVPLSPATVSTARSRRVAVLAAAAAVLLAVGVLLWSLSGRGPSLSAEVVVGQVWVEGLAVERLPAGAHFEIGGDAPAVLRLPDGSRVELGPSSKGAIRRRSGDPRQVVELAQGSGTFQVTHGGGRFQVETPVGTVTALGTEFSVTLRPGGKSKTGAKRGLTLGVTVTEGTVQVDAAGKQSTLSAGTSRSFGDDGDQNNHDDGEKNNRKDQR